MRVRNGCLVVASRDYLSRVLLRSRGSIADHDPLLPVNHDLLSENTTSAMEDPALSDIQRHTHNFNYYVQVARAENDPTVAACGIRALIAASYALAHTSAVEASADVYVRAQPGYVVAHVLIHRIVQAGTQRASALLSGFRPER